MAFDIIQGFLGMESRYKKIRIFLVLILSLSIPVCFTFIDYYSLSEADFLSTQLKLEARDQIDLLIGFQEKSKAFGLIGFNHSFLLHNNICGYLPVFSFQTSPLDLITFVLRC